MKNKFYLFVLVLIFSSCASIMNKKRVHVTILTNTPSKVVLHNDTFISKALPKGGNKVLLTLPRQKDSLSLLVLSDAVKRNLTVRSGNSFGYWLNIYATLGVGMLVDKNSPKRYTYPKQVSLDMNRSNGDTVISLPKNSHSGKYKNNIKFTPLRLLFSHPGLEFSYERYFGKRYSVQLAIAHLYEINFIEPEGKGTQFSAELKYFDIQRVKRTSPYMSLETGYYNIFIGNYVIEHKDIYYLIPKLGFQNRSGKNFIVEAYMGLGIKYQENSFAPGTTDEEKADYREVFWDAKPSLNVKIGYLF